MYKITLDNDKFEIKRTRFFTLINLLIGAYLIYFFLGRTKINVETAQYFWVAFQVIFLYIAMRGFFMQLEILVKNKPYLTIDESGIQSETHGIIDAQDIVNLKYTEDNPRRKLLQVKLVNPEAYLARFSGIKKILYEVVYKKSGTPVIIKLRGSFDSEKLEMLLDNLFDAYP